MTLDYKLLKTPRVLIHSLDYLRVLEPSSILLRNNKKVLEIDIDRLCRVSCRRNSVCE